MQAWFERCVSNTSLTALLLFGILTSCAIAAAQGSVQGGADHHMHLRSEDSADAWAALCDAMPQACGGDLPSAPEPTDASDVIPLLDAAGLEKAALLSIAYFFGFPELRESKFNDPALVRAENQFIADQVARYPGRLAGFFSVNPLADYAVEEVEYWAGRSELVGLKLHLANSNVDLRDQVQLERLAELFAILEAHDRVAVVHLRNRNPGYGYEDAVAFIDKVLGAAPGVTVQLAHMGGWGGYDQATDDAVQAFLDAIEDGRLDGSKIFFGLAAVNLPGITAEQTEMLGRRLREIGTDRILFGTDWDALGSPLETIEAFRAYDFFTPEEWAAILSNQAPWFD